MNKLLFLLMFYCLCYIEAQAQNSYIKNRWNFKACFSSLKDEIQYQGLSISKSVKNYRIEVNYGVMNKVETGVYLGYSFLNEWGRFTNIPFYGINTNFHLFPFFVSKDNFRFDLYLSGKFGGYYVITSDNYRQQGNFFDYGAYVGGGFYLLKHVGAFVEIGYGKKINLLYGLTFKFKKKI